MKWWTGVLLGSLLLIGSLMAQDQVNVEYRDTTDYLIGVGDKIRISYHQGSSFEDVGKSIETTVNEAGMVLIPPIGKVQVAGLTTDEVQKNIEREFSRYIENPQVFVEVVDYQSLTAVLMGAASLQGIFPLSPGMSASRFIAANGGVNASADLSKVTILRNNGELIRLDLRSFFADGVVAQDILLQPGDRVFIPSKEPPWLERVSRVVQLFSLVLQTVILIVVLGR